MPRIAVLGGTGYLASLIQSQNKIKKNKFIFFSRKKNSKNYINYFSSKKTQKILNNFDCIIHLLGPDQIQLKKNKNLIYKKKKITSFICDICIENNIKLIYVSSLQVYKSYGKSDIFINSKINKKDSYSYSHFLSEKIIKNKFINKKNMFIILRTGNVFGLKKNENLKNINNNLIHSFCHLSIIKKKIKVKNGYVQRTFIPSRIFVNLVNTIINKKLFKNSIINFSYKIYNLKNIAKLIQKRCKVLFNLDSEIEIENFFNKKKIKIYMNKNFKLKYSHKNFLIEIDQILINLKKYFFR